jgi:hypothetical protein
MGVTYSQINQPFDVALDRLESIPYPIVTAPSSSHIVLDSRVNAAFAAAFALLKEDVDVYRTIENFESSGGVIPAGSFIVRNTTQVQNTLADLSDRWPLTPLGLEDINGVATVAAQLPRIGLYQSFAIGGNMDEGWTRYVLDDFGIPYTTLHNSDMQKNLSRNFDVIVFADEDPAVIKTGLPGPNTSAYARSSEALPSPYQGGLGIEGINSIANFVGQLGSPASAPTQQPRDGRRSESGTGCRGDQTGCF